MLSAFFAVPEQIHSAISGHWHQGLRKCFRALERLMIVNHHAILSHDKVSQGPSLRLVAETRHRNTVNILRAEISFIPLRVVCWMLSSAFLSACCARPNEVEFLRENILRSHLKRSASTQPNSRSLAVSLVNAALFSCLLSLPRVGGDRNFYSDVLFKKF